MPAMELGRDASRGLVPDHTFQTRDQICKWCNWNPKASFGHLHPGHRSLRVLFPTKVISTAGHRDCSHSPAPAWCTSMTTVLAYRDSCRVPLQPDGQTLVNTK